MIKCEENVIKAQGEVARNPQLFPTTKDTQSLFRLTGVCPYAAPASWAIDEVMGSGFRGRASRVRRNRDRSVNGPNNLPSTNAQKRTAAAI